MMSVDREEEEEEEEEGHCTVCPANLEAGRAGDLSDN